jgi:hypothetical protein
MPMTEDQIDAALKIASAFADALLRLARAMEGIDDSAKRAVDKQWPDQRAPRAAVVSHVPTEDEKLKEAQGGTAESIEDWLQLPADHPSFQGSREREFLEERRKHTTTGEGSGEARKEKTGE